MGSYKTVSVDTTVDVDIDLDDFDDSDLVDEVKERGYFVFEKDDYETGLDKYEIQILTKEIGEQPIGSDLWRIREKLFSIMK